METLLSEDAAWVALFLAAWLLIVKVTMRCEVCMERAQRSFKRANMFIVEEESPVVDQAPPKRSRRRRRPRGRRVVKDVASPVDVEPVKPAVEE